MVYVLICRVYLSWHVSSIVFRATQASDPTKPVSSSRKKADIRFVGSGSFSGMAASTAMVDIERKGN